MHDSSTKLHNIFSWTYIHIYLLGSQVNLFLFIAFLRHNLEKKHTWSQQPWVCVFSGNLTNTTPIREMCSLFTIILTLVQTSTSNTNVSTAHRVRQNVSVEYYPLGSSTVFNQFNQLALAWYNLHRHIYHICKRWRGGGTVNNGTSLLGNDKVLLRSSHQINRTFPLAFLDHVKSGFKTAAVTNLLSYPHARAK
jgi:hypothetical protein